MRALITGGAGFVGSHLSDLLLAVGDVVGAPVKLVQQQAVGKIADLIGDRPTATVDVILDLVIERVRSR